MHGNADQDADLDSTPDFDSSQAESSSQLAPNVTVGAKQFRYTEVSFQPGYRCNMKCVFYIRKELCNMSCCHVARPCSNGSISARRRNTRRYPSSCCVSHISSYMFTAVLTMINRTWVVYLAIVHRHWRLAHACCFVDQLAGIAQHTVALSSTSSFPQRVTPTTKGCCTVRLVREMAHKRWSFLDAGLVRARASAYVHHLGHTRQH